MEYFPGKGKESDLPDLKTVNLMAIAVSQGCRNRTFAMLKDKEAELQNRGIDLSVT